MKKSILVSGLAATTLFLLSPCFAEEDGAVSGSASVTVRSVSGERESAKFEEYREIPDGLSGEVELRYKKKDMFFELKAKDIAEDDQTLTFRAGVYGKYRIELIYDKLPHRFAYGAKTLYTGVGSGNLTLSDATQTYLQGSTSATDLAARIRDVFSGASTVDLALFRKTGKANIDLWTLDPLKLRIELSREERTGTRPLFGSFGFGNTVEIAEPIDYETTQVRLIADYTKKPLHLSASFYLSVFDNNIDTLTWDNPFRVADSTTATAYAASFAAGPSRGLIDLYPSNKYTNFSLTGSISDLPLKSRISATASWGWMKQDDALVPYTSNTAISTGAVSGVSGVLVPFNAWDPANLPARNVDGEVKTSLYNVLFTSKPLDYLHVRARYRRYEYDNNTGLISFPGHVRMDAVWEPGHEANVPSSYKKSTAGIDLGLDVWKASTLTLGYTFENTERTNREMADQDENIYKVTFDTKPLSWLDLKLSYERSQREGTYNYLIPFIATHIGEELEGPVPQLPFLVKYDQANRDRDRVQFLATVTPIEPLTISGSVIVGQDDFKDSAFGLLKDRHNIYALDVDYTVNKRLNLFAFYSYERYNSNQRARQWSPSTGCIQDGDAVAGECTDPYTAVTTFESPSNWDAENRDKVNTFGGGLQYALIPNKLDFKLTYSHAKTDGMVKLSSPVGANNDVDANQFTPTDFTEVDDVKLQTLHAKLKYKIRKGLSLVLGYIWEKFDVKDFNNEGFTNIPTTAAGAYNGTLLMDTLWKNYDVSIVYAKLKYRF
jgi:MtrB/PioB family decaheme-associated outer membrane protein